MGEGSRWKRYFLLYFALAVYSVCGVFSKLAGKEAFLSPKFSLFCFGLVMVLGVYAILWQKILKMFPLTVAFSNKAIVVPLGMLWGYLFFQETITLKMIVGALIIFVGIVVIGGEKNE